MYCRDCRYPIHATAAHRCPECGRGFDPDDEASYLVRLTPPRPSQKDEAVAMFRAVMGALMLLLGLGGVSVVLSGVGMPVWLMILSVGASVLGAVLLTIAMRSGSFRWV